MIVEQWHTLVPDNHKLPLSGSPRRMRYRLTNCHHSESTPSYFDSVRKDKHRLCGCRSIGAQYFVGTQKWKYTQGSGSLSSRFPLLASENRDGGEVQKHEEQTILIGKSKEWIDSEKYSGAAWLNSVIDIARLSILLPLKYLIVMPLLWTLSRLKDGLKSPEAVLEELKANKEGSLDAATVARVFKTVGRSSPDLVVKVRA